MQKQYTQKQIDQILEKLPDELLDAVFSLETADAIVATCERYGIGDKRVREIATYVGHTLMGLLLPAQFQEILQKDLKFPKKVAEGMAHEINRFIFYPVKPALEQLNSTAIGTVSQKVKAPPAKREGEPEESQEQQRQPQELSGPDAYREPLEEE